MVAAGCIQRCYRYPPARCVHSCHMRKQQGILSSHYKLVAYASFPYLITTTQNELSSMRRVQRVGYHLQRSQGVAEHLQAAPAAMDEGIRNSSCLSHSSCACLSPRWCVRYLPLVDPVSPQNSFGEQEIQLLATAHNASDLSRRSRRYSGSSSPCNKVSDPISYPSPISVIFSCKAVAAHPQGGSSRS